MSFRDTFTRDEQRDADSNFDDYAFLYFSGAVLAACAFILTLSTLRRVIWPSDKDVDYPVKNNEGSKLRYCQTAFMKTRVSEKRSEQSSYTYLRSSSGITRLVVISVLWVLVAVIVGQIGDVGTEIKSFDPFQILDIASGATEADIKKAYRKMSLKYHPDKNPDDPLASANFIQVTKAYAALTDENARKNYEKYGNPDGPQNMKVGIGLPRIFLVKDNQVLFLCIFFLAILGLIPMLFILYYQKQTLYEANGVIVETLRFMSYYLNESTRVKNGAELLACSAESRLMAIDPLDDVDMKPIIEEMDDLKKSQFNKQPVVVRNNILIEAHMRRLHHLMSPRLREALDHILAFSLRICQSMSEIAMVREWIPTALGMIDFHRCLVQGMDSKDNSLLQIPHFTQETVKHCVSGKGAVRGLKEFIAQPADQRRGLVGMTPEQLADVDAFVSHVGVTQVTARAFVNDEAQFAQGDIATIEVKIDRTHLKEGEAAGPVHAPLFPLPKFEEWWIFLLENDRCIHFKKSRSQEKVSTLNIEFRLGSSGKKQFVVHAISDSYMGLDHKVEVHMDVVKAADVQKEIFVHPEDADLDKHPTLFDNLIAASKAEESDDSDDEEEAPQPNKAAAAVPDSDSDD